MISDSGVDVLFHHDSTLTERALAGANLTANALDAIAVTRAVRTLRGASDAFPAPAAPTGPMGARGPVSRRPFDASNSGGPIRHLTTERIKVTDRGIDYLERHIARFGDDAANLATVDRLRRMSRGELKPTQHDLSFYSHELRESVRYRRLGHRTGAGNDYDLWSISHTATLEDYRLPDFNTNGNPPFITLKFGIYWIDAGGLAMNAVQKTLLRSIEKHDGEWGWYQLDRVVNPRDLPDGATVMDVLRAMESDGLIIQQPSTPQNKFSITDAGREALAEVAS